MSRARGPLVFTLLVAAYVTAVLLDTLTLSPVARMVPLWVLLPTLVLLGVDLALTLAPRLAAHWSPPEKRESFATRKLLERGRSATGSEPEGRRASGPVLGWYALLPALVLCLDLRLALFLYTFSYARLRGRESFALSLLLAALLGGLAQGARWLLGIG